MSGTVKLSYHFNDDVMTYISWANGYKAGGFNLARVTRRQAAEGPLTPNFDTEFPRETVQSYEIGIKSMLADRTVRLNASVFDQKYTNFQLNTYTGIQFVVSSIRKVESKGARVRCGVGDAALTGLSSLRRRDLCLHEHHRNSAIPRRCSRRIRPTLIA